MSNWPRKPETLPAFRELEMAAVPILNAISNDEWNICDSLIKQMSESIDFDPLIPGQNEDLLNDKFILALYPDLMRSYADTWRNIKEGTFGKSWISLQDALDILGLYKKHAGISIPLFQKQLLDLERVYPYTVFFSLGMVVDCYECVLCGNDIDGEECPHRRGELYAGRIARAIIKGPIANHVSMVNNPKDKRCVMMIEDTSEEFSALRYLSGLLKDKKIDTAGFKGCNFSKIKNPKYNGLTDEDICSCGSKNSFSTCCKKGRDYEIDHVDLIAFTHDPEKASEENCNMN